MKQKKKPIRPNLFQRVVMAVATPVARVYVKWKYGFSVQQRLKMDEPFIAMSNHTTDNDMIYLALAVKNYLYFVCSEHLFRNGLASKLLVLAFNPIPLFKGSVASTTTREILTRLRDGNNIGIFPEGSRSFNGKTNPIAASTGKLVKHAKCALVTFKLQGGYFVAPRWTKQWRRGPIWGAVVQVYSSAQLAEMSVEQINQIIHDDLWEDAYQTQKQNPRKYVGDRRAKGIENFLYICPNCGGFETIRSEKNDFFCTQCRMTGHYDEYGLLSGEKLPFTTVPDWEDWQNVQFDRLYDQAKEGPLFTNHQVTLYEIGLEHTRTPILTDTLTGDKEGLYIGGYSFLFIKMEGTEYINLGNTFLFSYEGKFYDLTADYLCGVKYRKLYFKRLEREAALTGKAFDIAK